jgi:hypothetical protein
MSEVKVDTISERTAAGGVTIDGVLIKDGVATFQTAAGSPLVFEGATADAFETTFAITDPTADRTITFPDASITLAAGGTNTPYFYAYLSAHQVPPNGAWTKITCDTVAFQTGSTYDNTTNYRWTPAVAGKYFILGQAEGRSDTANQIGQIDMAIYKNGAIFIGGVPYQEGGRDATMFMATISGIIDMNDTDYVEFWAGLETGTSDRRWDDGYQTTHFMGYKLLD